MVADLEYRVDFVAGTVYADLDPLLDIHTAHNVHQSHGTVEQVEILSDFRLGQRKFVQIEHLLAKLHNISAPVVAGLDHMLFAVGTVYDIGDLMLHAADAAKGL